MEGMRKFKITVPTSGSIDDHTKSNPPREYKLTDLGQKVFDTFFSGYIGEISDGHAKYYREQIVKKLKKLIKYYREPFNYNNALTYILDEKYEGILYNIKSPTPEETELKETKHRRGRPRLDFRSHDK